MQDKKNIFGLSLPQALSIAVGSILLLLTANFRYFSLTQPLMRDYENFTSSEAGQFYRESIVDNPIFDSFTSILFWSLIISALFIINVLLWQFLSNIGNEVVFLERYVLPRGYTKKQYVVHLLKFTLLRAVLIFSAIVQIVGFIKYTFPASCNIFQSSISGAANFVGVFQFIGAVAIIFLQAYILLVLFRLFRLSYRY